MEILNSITSFVSSVGDAIDKNYTSPEEAGQLKNEALKLHLQEVKFNLDLKQHELSAKVDLAKVENESNKVFLGGGKIGKTILVVTQAMKIIFIAATFQAMYTWFYSNEELSTVKLVVLLGSFCISLIPLLPKATIVIERFMDKILNMKATQ